MRLRRVCTGMTAIVFAMALIAAPSMAERGKGRAPDRERPNRMDRMSERLELTSEQRDAIEKVFEFGRKRAAEHHKDMARLRHEMKGEMLKDEPSETALAGSIEKIGDLRTKQQVDRMKDRMAIRKLLTPEQRDRWFSIDAMRGRGGEERGRRFKGFGDRLKRRSPGTGSRECLPERGDFRDCPGPSGFSLDLEVDDAPHLSGLELEFGEFPDLEELHDLIQERLSLLDDWK